MSVHINEVEVEPRREQPHQQGQQEGGTGGGGPEPPQPQLANKVAATLALLHARDRRLVAD